MKTTMLLLGLFIIYGGPTWALSSLECVSNQDTTYSNNNRIGGVQPRPGMITNLEEIKIKGAAVYRVVEREPCGAEACIKEQPDLIDIKPDHFSFKFDQSTKHSLESEGNSNGPIYKEKYAIKFQIQDSFWMLCDYSMALVP